MQTLFITEEHEFTTACAHEFTLDLRDARWGGEQGLCLDGGTAEEMRVRLSSIGAARRRWDSPDEGSEDEGVLNGRRIFIIDEPEDGGFSCVAPGGELRRCPARLRVESHPARV